MAEALFLENQEESSFVSREKAKKTFDPRAGREVFAPALRAAVKLRGHKSLFASFSSEKEDSCSFIKKRRLLFFSEEKNQKTFTSWRRFIDPGLGRKIYLVPNSW